MSHRFALVFASLSAVALPILAAAPAAAQNAREYQYRRGVSNVCAPGMKLAAGACVRTCPAGYQDMGNRCRLRNRSR